VIPRAAPQVMRTTASDIAGTGAGAPGAAAPACER